jgi:uncharacterized membrane protein
MSSPSVPYDSEQLRQEQRFRASSSARLSSGASLRVSGAPRRMRYTQQHHPRVLAALCYTVPVVPAWILLTRKGNQRAAPFVRFHAAQSLVFHGMVAAAQIALYVVLMIAGGFVRDDLVASAIAVGLIMVWLMQAGFFAFTWSWLMADCIRGEARLLPLVGRLALRLERFAPRRAWARWRGRPADAA